MQRARTVFPQTKISATSCFSREIRALLHGLSKPAILNQKACTYSTHKKCTRAQVRTDGTPGAAGCPRCYKQQARKASSAACSTAAVLDANLGISVRSYLQKLTADALITRQLRRAHITCLLAEARCISRLHTATHSQSPNQPARCQETSIANVR